MLKEYLTLIVDKQFTVKECEVILAFETSGDMSTQQLSDDLNTSKTAIHTVVLRLRLKGAVEMKKKVDKGTIIYGLVDSLFP